MPKPSGSDAPASRQQDADASLSPVLRLLSAGFFVLFAVATMFQAPLFGARTAPSVLGLPFGLGWTLCWAAAAAFVLIALEWQRRR